MIKPKRRGFTMMDVMAGLTIALALAVIVSQMIVATAQQGRLAEQKRVAMQELASAMEQAASISYPDLNKDKLDAISLSPLAEQVLASAKLKFILADVAGPPAGRKITAEITWKIGPDEVTSPLRLVAWRYAPRENAP